MISGRLSGISSLVELSMAEREGTEDIQASICGYHHAQCWIKKGTSTSAMAFITPAINDRKSCDLVTARKYLNSAI